jgi:tetratricopeptide (TPR) repeat protein
MEDFMLQSKKSMFLNDAPVSNNEGNILWAENDEVSQRIEQIADAILMEPGELTFSVHGAWGTGKTSFLKMVQSSVQQRLPEGQKIAFCWYNASTFQDISSTVTTIALRILGVLSSEQGGSNDVSEQLQLWQSYISDILKSSDHSTKIHDGSPKAYEILERLALETGHLADFPRWLQQHLTGGTAGAGAIPRKLVLIVDDLDRCRSSFIGEVLDTVQRLNAVPNLFVLIAVDRDVLLKATRERYQEITNVRDEHLALEKYIQYSVDLPDISSDQLVRYVQRILEREKGKDEDEDRILALMIEDAHFFAIQGVRSRTPRAIKRTINAVRPVLQMRLKGETDTSQEVRQLLIKEQILAYNWRHFYQRYFRQAHIDKGSAAFGIFYRLEQLCFRYYSSNTAEESSEIQRDRRAIFDLQLERLKRREFTDDASLTIQDELAYLLATPPFWFYDQPKQQDPVNFDFREMGSDLTGEFARLYIASEQADAAGDARNSVEAARKAYEIVLNNKHAFNKRNRVAGDLGNLGVNAERFGVLDLAEALWRLALELSPEHSGCMQQFSSYIIDNRPDLYDEAEQLLERLQTGDHANHQIWRTLGLHVQLLAARGQTISPELIARMVEVAPTLKNARELSFILSALVKKGDEIQQALRIFGDRIFDFPDMSARYTIQRVLADALATRPEIANEFIAMDLYRQILAHPEVIDVGDEPMVMSNYAFLLEKHDYDDESGCLRFRAYQHSAGNKHPGIRESYARYLIRAGHLDLAEQVFNGDAMKEMVIVPTTKPLPDRFSDVDLPDTFGSRLKTYCLTKDLRVVRCNDL